ncbi:MAG: helix-turn-helix domain-containing protein [bacterium]|nr:helix-turn-helix domain-containing protein [bacterium]
MTKAFKTKELRGTKTVAQKLKIARKRINISLEDAERDTNIRSKYLAAFEDGQFEHFPSEVYAIGFLRRYAEYLSLPANAIISQYKIEWNAANSRVPNDKTKESFSPNSHFSRFDFSITPKSIVTIFGIIVVLSLLIYIWWAVEKFSSPPSLIITKPLNNQTITSDKITIEGRTDPGTYIYINNEPINVATNGKFSQDVSLSQDMTTLQIVAKNRLDRRSIHVIKVVDIKPK